MQDFFGFVGDSPLQQVYRAHGTDWQLWDKPRGITMVMLQAVGGGGGGGNGFTGVASSARGGGGGGGGGAISNVVVPAWVLPDRLYVQVGTGGAAVGAGTATNVSTKQSNQISLLIVSTNGGGAGGTGTASAAGAAGAVGANPLATLLPGVVSTMGGIAGQLGGAQTGAAGVAATMALLPSGSTNGGAGGGGTTSADFAGGAVTSMDTLIIPTLAGGVAGSNRGNDGYTYRGPGAPATLIPGSGGGASNSGVGGGGGNGGPGCGGGGGGGGTTGGTGGRGGDGFVYITCW